MMPDFEIIMDPIATVEVPSARMRRLRRIDAVWAVRQQRDVAKLLASFNDMYGETIFKHICEFVGKEFFTIDLMLPHR